MSIYKGSTLLAGNVSNGDAVTINTNSNDLLQAIGTINKNTSSFNYKYDWVGTFAQWQAQAIATTHPEWVCYIIDDSYDGVSVPTGTILPFGGVNAPEGFLICDGSAISRTTYSKLFNVIGESYGSGDGNSTFNIPNYNDRVPQGGIAGYKEAGLPNPNIDILLRADSTSADSLAVADNYSKYGTDGVTYFTAVDTSGYSQWGRNYFTNSGSTDEFMVSVEKIGLARTGAPLALDIRNTIYNNSTTVQPPACLSKFIIKY